MIVLWILLILLGIILLLLIMPITVYFKYNNDATLNISYMFIKFKVLPKSEKKQLKDQIKKAKKEKKKSKKETDKNKENKKPSIIEKAVDEFRKNHDFSEKANIVFELLKALFKRLKQLLKFLKIKKFNLFVKIGSDDVAQTALAYGRFCGAFYTFFVFILPLFRWGKRKISLIPDFTAQSSSAYVELSIRGSLLPFLIIALLLYKDGKNIISKL